MCNRIVNYLFFALSLIIPVGSLAIMVISAELVLEFIAYNDATLVKPIIWGSLLFLAFTFVFIMSSAVPFWDISNLVHGTPMSSCSLVEANHGDKLGKVAVGICGERVAYLALFAQDGTKLTEVTKYYFNDVMANEELIELYEDNSGCFEVHNHPDFLGKDRPFSPRDVAFAMTYGVGTSFLTTRDSVYELRFSRYYAPAEIRQARKLMRQVRGLFPSRERQILACEEVAKEFDMSFRCAAWPSVASEADSAPICELSS